MLLPDEDDETEQARRAFARVVQTLTSLLGRPSRWTGSLELIDNPFASGVAHLDGRVEITYTVWRQPAFRWRTLIHEALHLFSPSYTRQQYSMARGWEEGVVEQLQRLLRQQVFSALNIEVFEEVFAERDTLHEYNGYIAALDSLLILCGMDELDYYLWLLATPLVDRLTALRDKITSLPSSSQTSARMTLMLAQGKLGRG